MAALVVPISGPYVGTIASLPIGTLNDDGYELAATTQGQEINETDAYGMTLVEAIYRGVNWRCRIRGLEWKSGLLTFLQQFGQIGGAGSLTPSLLNVGNRWTSFAQPMLLSAILGNPPTTPQSLTATYTGIAPNSASAFNMTSKMRELPLELVMFPYTSGPNNIPFSTT